jgi:hypothetical protein
VTTNTGRLSDAIERLLPFLIVVALVTFTYFWFIQAPLNAYLRTRTDVVSLQARVRTAQDSVARAAGTVPVDVQGSLAQFEAQMATDNKVAEITAILAKAVLDSARTDQLHGFAIETGDRVKVAADQGGPAKVSTSTIGAAPDPRFGLFPYSVTYTPVRITFSSTFDAIASLMWKVRDLPTTIELRSATLTRGLPLMKMELLIWVYQRGAATGPELAVPPSVPGGAAPVGPRVARLTGAEG